MTQERTVREVIQSRPTMEGAGVRLRRAIGFGEPETYDPFLLLDDFRSDNPADYQKGFPWHPHRGMETITYILAGEVEHQDSLGNRGVIGTGDVQWMTAGSGIIHQEMPRGDAQGKVYGFQLWANLPAASKMADPRYRGIAKSEIPVIEKGGATVRVIAGTIDGTAGPVQDVVTSPEYFDISLASGQTFSHPTTLGHTVFAYVIDGSGFFGPSSAKASEADAISDGHLVSFHDGDQVSVRAGSQTLRFLLVSGRPIKEPIAWRGPIVMNTQAELRTAFAELEAGTFIKKSA